MVKFEVQTSKLCKIMGQSRSKKKRCWQSKRINNSPPFLASKNFNAHIYINCEVGKHLEQFFCVWHQETCRLTHTMALISLAYMSSCLTDFLSHSQIPQFPHVWSWVFPHLPIFSIIIIIIIIVPNIFY